MQQTSRSNGALSATQTLQRGFVWLRERLLPGGVGALMLAAYAIILTALVNFVLTRRELAPGPYYAVVLALAAMFVLHVVWDDLQERFGVVSAAWLHLLVNGALFLLVNYLGLNDSFSFLPFLLFMLSAQAMVDLPLRAGALYVLVLTGGWLVIVELLGGDVIDNLISISLGQIFAVSLARVLRLYQEQTERAKQLLAELQAAHSALEAAREREKDLAAAEERVRLAREIHDGLGHHLTVLNVQLQAAARLVERDPERAAQAIALCREEAQAALVEVRQSVAAMRHSPLDGRSLPEALATLVRDFDRASPLAASFALRGRPVELAPAAAMTLYRAAQEGLTNAQKHAGAGDVQVELAYNEVRASLRVQNSGSGVNLASASPGGFGLAGLRERAELLGGSFRAGAAPTGGFVLELELALN